MMGRGLSEQQKDCLRLAYAIHLHNGGNGHQRFARYEQPENFRSACGFFDRDPDCDAYRLWHRLMVLREWNHDAGRFYVCGKPLALKTRDILTRSEDVSLRRAVRRLQYRGLLVSSFSPHRRVGHWYFAGQFLTDEGIRIAQDLPPMPIPEIAQVLAWSASSKGLREAHLRRGHINGCAIPSTGKAATDTAPIGCDGGKLAPSATDTDNGCGDDITNSATNSTPRELARLQGVPL